MADIEYLNDQQTEWLVDYGAKVRPRYKYVPIPNLTEIHRSLIFRAMTFTRSDVNPTAVLNMTEDRIYSLAEREAKRFCGMYAPMKNYGLEKAIIRYWVLRAILQVRENSRKEDE